MLAVARQEALEAWRDPQVATVVGGMTLLAYLILLNERALDPDGASGFLGLLAPLGIVFVAGPRRGHAREAAFVRLVATCPLTPAEVWWGRVLGRHALALAYAALVAPAFAIELTASSSPFATLLDGILAFAALAFLAIVAGLALPPRHANVVLPIAAFVSLVVYKTSAYAQAGGEGLSFFVVAAAFATLPSFQLQMAAGLVPGLDAPSWAIAAALATTLALAIALARRRHRAIAAGAWLLGVALLTATLSRAARGGFGEPPASGLFDLLPVCALLALVPFGVAVARWVATR